MQNIIIEKPYKFVPPHRGTWWSSFIQTFNLHGRYLRKSEGVCEFECRHVERLKASLDAGHGILLAPNHCRNGDPLVLGWLAREVHCHVYAMASWHLFNQDGFTSWAIRKMGGFSVNREGMDRQAINEAISVLENAERPLIIFPEGAVTRTNDKLHALLDGVGFIARTAAKRRAKKHDGGKVVVHPIGIKYFFSGDIEKQGDEVLSEIEQRLSWRPQRDLPLIDRISKVGQALLTLKEIEYFGRSRSGPMSERMSALINRLLEPLEEEWLRGAKEGAVVPRIKNLRMQIMPEIINNEVDEKERDRRWNQLADLYLAQQVSCYPPGYLETPASVDRILETLERFEEDLTDKLRVHGNLKVVIDVGEARVADTQRDRSSDVDPIMDHIESELTQMLGELSKESPLYEPSGGTDSSVSHVDRDSPTYS